MSEVVDTGFDAVLAGEKWEAPAEEKPAPPASAPGGGAPQHAERLLPSDGAAPGADPSISANAEIRSQTEITATVTASGLTPDGVEAAKALLKLPHISASDLAKLARELAMNIKERHVVLKEYALSENQYEFLEANNEFFKAALNAACIEWHAPLSTQERIKVEAAAILEDSLVSLGARMLNKSEGLPGVVEAAKLFAKVAGVGERDVGQGSPSERFTINIDLGGDQKLTVSATPPAPQLAGPDSAGPV